MVVLIFAFLSLVNQNIKELYVKEDLQQRWKILQDGKLVNFDNHQSKTVHLPLKLKEDEGFLRIHSQEDFYLFINSDLITKSRSLMLSVDSLKKKYGEVFFVSIYQSNGVRQLTTQLVKYEFISQYYNPLRPDRSFNNFILLATILLIILFTALLYSNPQLTWDYLNITKLFSIKRRDDSQFVLRVTSSVNLLFYFFCSLLTSLALITAAHFSEAMSFLIQSNYQNVIHYAGQWFLISFLIAGLLMLKLGLALLTSLLFGWRNTAGFQFFNFTRVLVTSLFLIGGVSIFCFSMGINMNYYFLVKCFCLMLSTGAVLMFFKLLNRESTSVFHLFSYLCATEIFPLVILIKVFLF